MCDTCEVTARLNDRYRDTIERLTRERDELREMELVLSEIFCDKVVDGDAGRPHP